MGLDMYLYRFPRFKGYGPEQLMAADEYFDGLESESGQEYGFEEWCGAKESDLPSKEDMEYLKGQRHIRFADWDTDQRYPHMRAYENVMYWRKANAIHRWFVNNVQGGEDDCEFHFEVTKEVLKKLRDVCKEVLKSAVLVQGKIENGYSFEMVNGKIKKIPHMVEGKYILDTSVCEELLPTEEGFFFGGTGYNEYYLNDVEDTFEICCQLLDKTDFDSQMNYYRSSW